jgi:hypothetical protein
MKYLHTMVRVTDLDESLVFSESTGNQQLSTYRPLWQEFLDYVGASRFLQ